MALDIASAEAHRASAATQSENNWAFLGFIWRRKWLAVACIPLAMGLGYLHFLRQAPVYQSTAQLLVHKNEPELPIDGAGNPIWFDKTHEVLIRSPVFVQEVVDDNDLASLPSLEGVGDPISKIISNLSVAGSASASSDVIRFTYRSTQSDDCPKVLRAIVGAYQKYLKENHESLSRETVKLISDAKKTLDEDLRALEVAYLKFKANAPLLWRRDGSGESAQDSMLAKIESTRSENVLNITRLNAKIEGLLEASKQGADREVLNALVRRLFTRDNLVSKVDEEAADQAAAINERLIPLMIQEKELLDHYGDDHPSVKAVRRRIELTREFWVSRTPAADRPAVNSFRVYLESLGEEIKLAQQHNKKLSELAKLEREAAKAVAIEQAKESHLRGAIERKQRLFDALVHRLEEINLMKSPRETETDLITPPGRGRQVEPNFRMIMMRAGLLGGLAGLVLAFVVDSLDRRYRNPHDIHIDLGLPVVGHVPFIRGSGAESKSRSRRGRGDEDEVFSPALTSHFKPRGQVAEAYRAVRNCLYFSARGGGNRVIQVTSPHQGDGKTTLATNLAISIAQAGKKVMLLEGDFRCPDVHKLFGLDNTIGICTVIADKAPLSDAIQETAIDNLSVMTSGPVPKNPAELITSRRFQEVLEELRDKHDFLIVDSPPLLVVTDSAAVAARVDGVFLVLRLTKNARHHARSAKEILDSLEANVLGVVVNGVSATGPNAYSDKYGYGYKIGYGFGDHLYYEDPEEIDRES